MTSSTAPRSTTAMETTALKANLLRHAEDVCRHLLPRGNRRGTTWLCGNLRGEFGNSLSVNLSTGIWSDFATGEKGANLLELWRQVRGIDFATAHREAVHFFGKNTSTQDQRKNDRATQRARWPTFEVGTSKDLVTVAKQRGIAMEGIKLASERGLLRFAKWREQPCWIITDGSCVNAQARRMDGKPFAIADEIRKTDTLPGSRAGVPLGIGEATDYSAVAIVEGGPDLLAAHGCIWAEERDDVAVVSVLGASIRPGPELWVPLAGKRVRVFVHGDDNGMEAGRAWAKAILTAGALRVDGFRFSGLRQTDGSRVKDLNDLLALHPDDFEARRDVWEVLP